MLGIFSSRTKQRQRKQKEDIRERKFIKFHPISPPNPHTIHIHPASTGTGLRTVSD
jgi:hypothetical protein